MKKPVYITSLVFSLTLVSCGGGGGGSSSSQAQPEAQVQSDGNIMENIVELTQQAEKALLKADTGADFVCNTVTFTKKEIIEALNAMRAKPQVCGDTSYPAVGPLTWNDSLTPAASNHAKDMATINFFSHTGSNGLRVNDRVTNLGFNWLAVGENIAAGQTSVAQAMQEWLASPSHCSAIMNDTFKETSLACEYNEGSQYKYYWVNVFAKQP